MLTAGAVGRPGCGMCKQKVPTGVWGLRPCCAGHQQAFEQAGHVSPVCAGGFVHVSENRAVPWPLAVLADCS